jgi:hypothetical protein
MNGWIFGSLHKSHSLLELLEFLTRMEDSDLASIISKTPFASIIKSDSDFNLFRDSFNKEILNYKKIVSNHGNNYGIEQVLRDSKVIFRNEGMPQFFNGRIDELTSKEFSIYRFRNTKHSNNVYFVNSTSMKAISDDTLNLYACFLFLFNPILVQEGVHNISVLPGEQLFSLENVNSQFIWEKLFSYTAKLSSIRSNKRARLKTKNPGIAKSNPLLSKSVLQKENSTLHSESSSDVRQYSTMIERSSEGSPSISLDGYKNYYYSSDLPGLDFFYSSEGGYIVLDDH